MARKKKEAEAEIQEPQRSRKDTIREIVAGINKEHGIQVIKFADEATNPYTLRRPFGIASLDIAIGGGMPAGCMVQIAAPDGVGKNAIANQAVATHQSIYGDDASVLWVCFESMFDKALARINNVIVPASDDDIEFENNERQARGLPELDEGAVAEKKRGIGTLLVCDTGESEDKLQVVVDILGRNICHLIIIDSLAAVVPKDRTSKDLEEEPRQAGLARLLTEFQRLCWYRYGHTVDNSLNLTTMLAINQVRSKQKKGRSPFQREWQVSGAHAIRHGKFLDILLTNGESITSGSVKVGKNKGWEITKGKAGCHEGPKGELRYYYETGFDVFGDLVATCKRYGILVQNGPRYDIISPHGEVIEERVVLGPGGTELANRLSQTPELAQKLFYYCLEGAGVSCLHKL